MPMRTGLLVGLVFLGILGCGDDDVTPMGDAGPGDSGPAPDTGPPVPRSLDHCEFQPQPSTSHPSSTPLPPPPSPLVLSSASVSPS